MLCIQNPEDMREGDITVNKLKPGTFFYPVGPTRELYLVVKTENEEDITYYCDLYTGTVEPYVKGSFLYNKPVQPAFLTVAVSNR